MHARVFDDVTQLTDVAGPRVAGQQRLRAVGKPQRLREPGGQRSDVLRPVPEGREHDRDVRQLTRVARREYDPRVGLGAHRMQLRDGEHARFFGGKRRKQ